MKCKHCDGVGFYENGASQFKCVYCDGSGEVPMTNEEWFCSLDTEDKAREISDMTAQGYWSEELVEKWLKEKHEESE